MLYLSVAEARSRKEELRSALRHLLSTKALVTRPVAAQWKLLETCLERLLSTDAPSEFEGQAPARLAQLKFEAQDRLRRFYLRPGQELPLLFTLIHHRDLELHGLPEDYPSAGGYCVLVRDVRQDTLNLPSSRDVRLYLERAVAEAVDAEFAAYLNLPQVDDQRLSTWFVTGGPAYKEIMNLLERHRQREWVLRNPLNPSTKRLIAIDVREVGREEAVVKTTEYWYLRWWSERDHAYTYPYRETNRQTYVLRREDGDWKVYQNLRPSPRTTTPHRRRRI